MSDGDIKSMKYISNSYDKDVRIKNGVIFLELLKSKSSHTIVLFIYSVLQLYVTNILHQIYQSRQRLIGKQHQKLKFTSPKIHNQINRICTFDNIKQTYKKLPQADTYMYSFAELIKMLTTCFKCADYQHFKLR